MDKLEKNRQIIQNLFQFPKNYYIGKIHRLTFSRQTKQNKLRFLCFIKIIVAD